jgi:uncharacterized protein (DUF1501 family)
MSTLSRRSLLSCVAASGVASLATPLWTRATFAAAATDKRFVLIILRGGLDGLAAVPPYGDSAYDSARGDLAIGTGDGGIRKLDGTFGLNPFFKNFEAFYQKRELAVVHAIASPYRERSHFEAQNVLENGTAMAHSDKGWLNRALTPIGLTSPTQALAISQSVPVVLQGEHQVSSWMPNVLPEVSQDYLHRVLGLYEHDQTLRVALEQGMQVRNMANGGHDGEKPMDGGESMRGARAPNNLVPLAKTAGELIAKSDGPRVAVLEATGWDTHAAQGAEAGQLARRLENLDQAIGEFAKAMTTVWAKTAVVLVTEFGRTVAPNGSNGTDHGTGGVAFVLGGGVKGGQVIADWPGLSQSALYEGRDLKPTTDMRAIFKAALISHMGVDEAAIEASVFPSSRDIRPLTNLFA